MSNAHPVRHKGRSLETFERGVMFSRPVSAALAAIVLSASTAAARADTQIGIQGIAISGRHFENTNDVSGSGLGGFFEITQRWRMLRVHLEGIPVVDTAHATSDRYGALTQTFGLFNGVAKKRVGILPGGRAPAREGTEILKDGTVVGGITSGGFGPSLNEPAAMGYVETAFAADGTQIDLIVRGKPLAAKVAPMPFVPHRYRRAI